MQNAAWRSGLGYSRAGVAHCRMRPQLFGLLTGLFCLPLALALALSVGAPEAPWLGAASFILTSVTVVGGGLTMMVAVDASSRGESPSAGVLLSRALGYLPRYLLTNAQTTLFFWSIMLPAIVVAGLVTTGRPAWLAMIVWAVVVVLGIVCHLHTMFAPYLAIYDGLPPPRAVVEGFRMTQRQLGTTAVTFLSAVAVVGLPLLVGLAALWAYASWEGPAAATRFDHALPYLMAGLVQLVRPVMVAAVHGLYADLARSRPEIVPA
jgi:hypothetical protein